MIPRHANWAGNYEYSTTNVHHPETIQEVQDLVRDHEKLRVLGTRHSFNAIADSNSALIALDRFKRIVQLDRQRSTVTIEAGVTYGQLGEDLHRQGFALPNLASLPDISVAGACATATHGSGVANRNLAAAVAAMEIVHADGQLLTLSRERDAAFDGMVVALGGLGVVTRLTLDVVPTFQMRQEVYELLPLTELEHHFDAIVSSAYSVSLFTDWQSDWINQVWLKRLGDEALEGSSATSFFGAAPARSDRHPIRSMSPENCTAQMRIIGSWYDRLPHFRSGCTPSSGKELQAEYFVARAVAVPAIRAVQKIKNRLGPLLMISELRTIAADTLWMSPCYARDSVGIHFTLKQDPAVEGLLEEIEAALEPFDPRPHWGTLFRIPPHRLQSRYARLA